MNNWPLLSLLLLTYPLGALLIWLAPARLPTRSIAFAVHLVGLAVASPC